MFPGPRVIQAGSGVLLQPEGFWILNFLDTSTQQFWQLQMLQNISENHNYNTYGSAQTPSVKLIYITGKTDYFMRSTHNCVYLVIFLLGKNGATPQAEVMLARDPACSWNPNTRWFKWHQKYRKCWWLGNKKLSLAWGFCLRHILKPQILRLFTVSKVSCKCKVF